MIAQKIDGNKLAKSIRSELKSSLKELDFTPGLGVIQIGNDPASTVYVKHKQNDCKRLGFHWELHQMPENSPQEKIIDRIKKLNSLREIHGILVQMPMPAEIDTQSVINSIEPTKDVDGLHPINLGNLLSGSTEIAPCTPRGIVRMLDAIGAKIEGQNVVCVGRSILVGKPMGLLLLARNATVSYCHSRTTDLSEHTKNADILVIAVGKPKIITADMVKPGAVVIDVGINRVGDRLIGDVDYEKVREVASFITPVPGGVGPMTRAMLLENTLTLAKLQKAIGN